MVERTERPPPPATSFDASVQAFQRDGHVRLRAFYSADEIARLDDALIRAQKPTNRLLEDVDRVLTRDGFFWQHSDDVAAFVLDPRLGVLAAKLLGARGIRLIHEALLKKESEHGVTPWHRDSDFWSFTGIGALTMWIPLQDTPLRMSPLRYASSSHRKGNQQPLRPIERALIPLRFRVASSMLDVGDIAIHHYKTLHGAGRNQECRPRRALAIHLIDADARFRASQNQEQRYHAARCSWDRLQDGDRFTDEIAPLLYSSESRPLS